MPRSKLPHVERLVPAHYVNATHYLTEYLHSDPTFTSYCYSVKQRDRADKLWGRHWLHERTVEEGEREAVDKFEARVAAKPVLTIKTMDRFFRGRQRPSLISLDPAGWVADPDLFLLGYEPDRLNKPLPYWNLDGPIVNPDEPRVQEWEDATDSDQYVDELSWLMSYIAARFQGEDTPGADKLRGFVVSQHVRRLEWQAMQRLREVAPQLHRHLVAHPQDDDDSRSARSRTVAAA